MKIYFAGFPGGDSPVRERVVPHFLLEKALFFSLFT